MRKVIGLLSLIVLFVLGISFVLSERISWEYAVTSISASSQEDLRSQAQVECLSNSQCLGESECLENKCIDREKINLCQNIKLVPTSQHLSKNDSINKFRDTFTDGALPYLLTDGTIVAVIGKNLTIYEYVQVIKLGNKKLSFNQEIPVINSEGNKDEPLYILGIYFSNGIDFSNENIKGQSLRILGKEYVIGDKSTNSVIYLISEDRKIKLRDEQKIILGSQSIENVKVTFRKDVRGHVLGIEMSFVSEDKRSNYIEDKHLDPVFNAIEISLNQNNMKIGGYC